MTKAPQYWKSFTKRPRIFQSSNVSVLIFQGHNVAAIELPPRCSSSKKYRNVTKLDFEFLNSTAILADRALFSLRAQPFWHDENHKTIYLQFFQSSNKSYQNFDKFLRTCICFRKTMSYSQRQSYGFRDETRSSDFQFATNEKEITAKIPSSWSGFLRQNQSVAKDTVPHFIILVKDRRFTSDFYGLFDQLITSLKEW